MIDYMGLLDNNFISERKIEIRRKLFNRKLKIEYLVKTLERRIKINKILIKK